MERQNETELQLVELLFVKHIVFVQLEDLRGQFLQFLFQTLEVDPVLALRFRALLLAVHLAQLVLCL